MEHAVPPGLWHVHRLRAYGQHSNRKHRFHTSGPRRQPSGQHKLFSYGGTIGHFWERRLCACAEIQHCAFGNTRQLHGIESSSMADERSYEYTPPEFSMTVEATASTSCGGTTRASSTLGAYTTIPDDAWQYQWNTPPTPITEVTYNVEGVPDNGITCYQQLGCDNSINQARPSTSRAGMEEASANFEGGATISESTIVHQGNTQFQLAESTSTVFGHTDMTETKSTGFALPVYSSSSGDYAVASTSRIGTEKASDCSGNDARRWCSGGAEAAIVEGSQSGHKPPAFTFGDEATPSTSQEFFEGASWTSDCSTALCDDSFEDLWNALNSHNDASDITGHTYVTESRITNALPMASSSSVNHAQPSTSRAGMEEASAVPENFARNAPGTGGMEQRDLCGAYGNVSSRADALHGHAKEPRNDTAQICKACDHSSVKMSKSVEHCHNLTGKKQKCEACDKQFRWASDLAKHQPTHTDERRYKCEICEKMFRQASRLSSHRRKHTDEKPYLCITCGRTYKWPSDLRKHERTHAEANRHTCQKCAKSFENKYDLKRHVGTRCGNSAFICDICDRFFMRNSALRRHHRTKHADETPYECTQCGCRFADRETLDRHLCQKERRM
ncbi:uncharacterized protein [Dermacentor albipictus]|uniref:uncharacterized protein n=1 Tax=Dermacentor albipictus TaxID=60249 RepID=UPI0038FD1DE9